MLADATEESITNWVGVYKVNSKLLLVLYDHVMSLWFCFSAFKAAVNEHLIELMVSNML